MRPSAEMQGVHSADNSVFFKIAKRASQNDVLAVADAARLMKLAYEAGKLEGMPPAIPPAAGYKRHGNRRS